MDRACRAFRDEWLRYESAENAHASLCAGCLDWARSTERQIQALGGLARLAAPAELDQRVQRELAGERSHRLERALGRLARLGAPAALDRLVLGQSAAEGDAERGEQRAQALRALDLHPAPGVLERLLEEELQHPERQRSERFSGSLERLHAPRALEERLGSSVRRRALLRLLAGPLMALAAAGLVVWVAIRQDAPSRREYRFQVIHASSPEDLDPLARGLAEALSGGAGGIR